MDLVTHLTRQAAFSKATFGPGARTEGVTDHIKKELDEVAKCYGTKTRTIITGSYVDPADMQMKVKEEEVPIELDPQGQHEDAAEEWTDVAILGLDGLTRAISAAHPDWTFDKVASKAVSMIVAKQGKNELRDWPDWRTAAPGKAIEHVRGSHD